MTNLTIDARPAGLVAIEHEMARQAADARATFENARPTAEQIAASLRKTGQLVLLGMGGSHAVGRGVEPFYRALGIDAVTLPLSEQLGTPLRTEGKTILVTSQSGESAEVLRWFAEGGATADTFGLTLEEDATLARTVPSLIGAGGSELAFAATRSLTVTFAQHLAILAALGEDPAPALATLAAPAVSSLEPALAAFAPVRSVVTSGRLLRGLAEAIALGVAELSRLPAFALEGGQLRHGPMEMLGPDVGILQFRSDETTAGLVAVLSADAAAAGSPVVVLDSSGAEPAPGTVTVAVPKASGIAAIFALLPLAQRFMVAFAASRIADVGTPRRSTKITRTE
jgi:fructoselysine-6-P-deglycase FrlB-like protein